MGIDKRKKNGIYRQTKNHVKKFNSEDFNNIFEIILSKISVSEIKKTDRKKYIVSILIMSWTLSLFYPDIIKIVQQQWWGLVWVLGWIVLPIALVIVDGDKYYYKIGIIKSIVQIIKPDIKFEEKNIDTDVVEYKEDLEEKNYKYKLKNISGNTVIEDIYPSNGFSEGFNYMQASQFMIYDINSSTKVKIAEVSTLSKYVYGHGPAFRTYYSYARLFNGIGAKISREKFVPKELLIKVNKDFNFKCDSTESFEEIFDLKIIDEVDKEFAIDEFVKSEIVRLYKEYGIMFEISIAKKDMYIRFYVDELFSKKFFVSVINKKELHREFSIMKCIFEIIERVNEIL